MTGTAKGGREAREKKFSLEMANAKLGVDLQQEDEVTSAQEDGKDWGGMDQAFVEDLGFSLTQLRQMLLVLARWQSMGGESDLRLSYQASAATIADKLKESIDGLADDA